MKTHRCKESLKNEISINYSIKYKNVYDEDDFETWRLFKNTYDWDYDSHYQNHIAEIKYCPFCGIKLEGELND